MFMFIFRYPKYNLLERICIQKYSILYVWKTILKFEQIGKYLWFNDYSKLLKKSCTGYDSIFTVCKMVTHLIEPFDYIPKKLDYVSMNKCVQQKWFITYVSFYLKNHIFPPLFLQSEKFCYILACIQIICFSLKIKFFVNKLTYFEQNLFLCAWLKWRIVNFFQSTHYNRPKAVFNLFHLTLSGKIFADSQKC